MEIKDSATGQRLIQQKTNFGIHVNILPKVGFSKKFGSIAIPFGSIHTSIKTSGKKFILPSGTAHYMEHCIFSKDENGGLLSLLSSLGANANAYTSNTHTMYYFTSSENYSEILKIYTDKVINPYLEEDRIEAERSIIIQELDMYKDSPESRAYNELLSCLYVKHPVRADIGGTRASVNKITSKHLKAVKNSFYSPASITLTLSGDVSERDIPDFGVNEEENIENNKFYFPIEPPFVRLDKKTLHMDVSVQSFLLGFKNPDITNLKLLSGFEKARISRSGRLFMEIVLGRSSDAYEKLFSQGLINDSFDFSFVCENNYSFLVLGGDSPNPEKAVDEIKKILKNAITRELTNRMKEEFVNQKRSVAGSFIRSMDTIDLLGMSQARASLDGLNIFQYPEIYDNINLEKAAQIMSFILDERVVSEVYVKEKEQIKNGY